jgi:tight adherence protein B
MSDIAIYASVFFVVLSIIGVIPGLFKTYRESYQSDAQRTARELSKFFLNIKPIQILTGSVILGALLGAATGSWVLALVLMAAGLVAPKLLLSLWKEIRSAQFEAQLIDGLLLISNSLRSGLDILSGIERVANSLKPPISEEFGLVLNAYRLGTPLETAMLDMTTRINSRTLETVIYAVNIQRESGGNIIKTFDQLILSIREESKLQKKVRAMTSQGRSQIFVLAGFPWVLAIVFAVMAPDLLKPARESSIGQIVLVFLIVWEIIGIVITKKIVTVDI